MSMLNGSYSDPATQMASDANFDSFIESDLILDSDHAISDPIQTPTKKKGAMGKGSKNKKVTPLSALPSKLSSVNIERHTTPGTPGAAMNDFINFSQASDPSVTTPTTSNSSSLQNLNFDLYDGSDGAASVPGANDVTSPEADMSNVATPSASSSNTHFFAASHNTDSTMSEVGSMHAPMDNSLFGMAHMSAGITPFGSFMSDAPMTPLQQRSVDDMGHQFGHQSLAHHHGHHQRSMSLRDMASTMQGGIQAFTPQALASFGYPGIEMKMEHSIPNGMPAYPMNAAHMPGSITSHEQDDKEDKPRHEKKRRLTDGSSADGKDSGKGAKAGSAKKSGNGARKSRSNTTPSKNTTIKSKNEADQKGVQEDDFQITANSLIENVPHVPVDDDSSAAKNASSETKTTSSTPSGTSNEQSIEPEEQKTKKKTGTKRPPPSAFQITEAGMPFPVIDTSAKHSSLFIPPDTSGLTKREARLVKNRAAAFLSRQRKREQFEELEIKCRNLCRLVWQMWGAGSGNVGKKSKNPFVSQEQFTNFVSEQEGEEVQEIFDTVLALKGGSIAPTEDGQLQGAVAAGIKSENGKIVGDASAVVHIPSSAAKAAEEASKELARLRCELDEYQKREAGLHAELAHERGLRLKMEFDILQREKEMKPFRGGGQQDLSLTQPATFDDDDDNEDDVSLQEDLSDRRSSGQKSKKRGGSPSTMRPSRTSRRIQGQAQNALTIPSSNANSSAAGQRKAAGAALMMVLFSFALFGLPGGQTGRVGGISHAPGSTDLYPLGRVLGAPLSGSQLSSEEDEEGSENDRNGQAHLAPSSHLSVDDLFPAMHDILSEAHQDKQQSENKKTNFNFDYKAFAKDLESSLDWDMQRGFLVLGGDDEESGSNNQARRAGSRSPKTFTTMDLDNQDSESDVKDAPTKLTLFVPAPDMSVNSEAGSVTDASEDRFYDAPLADFDERSNGESVSEQQRELTQAEATRAALQVLRNHRVASEAAAFAASRRLGRQASPSHRVQSPKPHHQGISATSTGKKITKNATEKRSQATPNRKQEGDNEEEDEEDFSSDVLEATSPATDRIRGTDFYQLEFSLSGAKVRNVAELARLLGSMRGEKGDTVDHVKVK